LQSFHLPCSFLRGASKRKAVTGIIEVHLNRLARPHPAQKLQRRTRRLDGEHLEEQQLIHRVAGALYLVHDRAGLGRLV
jgi:hypothetical protein